MGFLSYMAAMVLLSQISHHHLTFEGICLFLIEDQDWLVPFLPCLRPLRYWWLVYSVLASLVPWTLPPPILFIETDTSKGDWSLQSPLSRHRRACKLNISGYKLTFTCIYAQELLFSRTFPPSICFQMVSQVAV